MFCILKKLYYIIDMKEKNEKDSKEVRMMKQQIRRNMITKVREDRTKYKRNRDKKISFVFQKGFIILQYKRNKIKRYEKSKRNERSKSDPS